MTKKFQRKIENFTCAHCGAAVVGDGYTNHCPHCLFSRHVDINPGDRAAPCGGLMRPVGFEQVKGEWRILHECQICGFARPNRLHRDDDQAKVLSLMKTLSLS
jgi:hypothetical protein